ncbi:Ketohexokinase [Orchesella cincta]|uniref:Ketohexokinase n=1 Tax=Orchesella cincta TaxID=48709 RepID=A0A1D2N427_ORCCI|nr:Ketohexokinase [Orchesella cincta]
MICSVGLTCVDIVSFLPEYPLEDSDQRSCTKQSWERGGNASNNATVLSCLGASVEYFGTLADDNLLHSIRLNLKSGLLEIRFLQNDMDSLGIKRDNCPIIQCGTGPISVVICSEETGSRTIIHAKGNLPELTLTDLEKLDISKYSWIHFEGRNEASLPSMLTRIKDYNSTHLNPTLLKDDDPMTPTYRKVHIPVSVEVEKHREALGCLLPLADVVLVGKDFAMLQGAKDCMEAARIISTKVQPGTVVVCPWGDQGASYCIARSNPADVDVKKQDAYVPDKIIDSLGAGDTFNSTVIYCLHKGLDVSTSVDLGCRIASEKLKIRGFKGIRDIVKKSYTQLCHESGTTN